jgi:hypothetical protein
MLYHRRLLTCNCLNVMSGREDFVLAVAEYLTMFETIGYVAQKTTVTSFQQQWTIQAL